MKHSIRSKRTRLIALVATAAGALVVAAASAAPVVNGDFQTGTLAGWTTFTTGNGTIGTPAVVSFDTTGTGASLAAQFNVGQVVPAATYEGGGIFQTVVTPHGAFNLSADIAAIDEAGSANASCARFELLVDGSVVATHEFGACPAVGTATRFALTAPGLALAQGSHEIRVRVTRAFTSDPPSTPFEYVDNVSVVASCAGVPATITGSGVLTGTPGDDVIVGGFGNDVIRGGGGNDTICGGQGQDSIYGDAGNDVIFGDDGLAASSSGGRDSIWGGDGNDTIDGEAGNDSLWGGANDDVVRGGLNNDGVFGEAGNDDVQGDADTDALDGGVGNDTLTGGAGNDTLSGQAGNDALNGDLGPTPPGTLDPVASLDICNGGANTDTAVFCEAQLSIP